MLTSATTSNAAAPDGHTPTETTAQQQCNSQLLCTTKGVGNERATCMENLTVLITFKTLSLHVSENNQSKIMLLFGKSMHHLEQVGKSVFKDLTDCNNDLSHFNVSKLQHQYVHIKLCHGMIN